MTQREVILEGGLPWGFRIQGGVDLKTPIKISRVNPGSKAAQRGIREGDLVTAINDQRTKKLTNPEAHDLLRKSGSVLKLGLNEDIEASPKRRQYRTVHQETHQETVKRSSLSYSLKETIETSSSRREQNNEYETSKKVTSELKNNIDTTENGKNIKIVTNIPISQNSTSSNSSTSTPSTLIPEGKNITSDHAQASRQSSYSNCSSIPDEGIHQQDQRDREVQIAQKYQEMNNGQERTSKSKKRRQRRKNLLTRNVLQENQNRVEIKELSEEILEEVKEDDLTETEEEKSPEKEALTVIKNEENQADAVENPKELKPKNIEYLKIKRIEHKYKVDSPKELKIESIKNNEKKLKAKSKSLDDDDLLRIQELSEASENEESRYSECNVLISEASSEENILDDSDSDSQIKTRISINSISTQLNDQNQLESNLQISPAEELNLRHFLGGLKLINTPEESAKDLYERTVGQSDHKAKKLQTRKELEEYFTPIAENPRYLDAISEETSDISDKDTSHSPKPPYHVKKVAPELDIHQITPPVPPRRNKNNLISKKINQQDKQSTLLVETKVLDPQHMHETVCNTILVPEAEKNVEIVYINESGESSTSSGEFSESFEKFKKEEQLDSKVNLNSIKSQSEQENKSNKNNEKEKSPNGESKIVNISPNSGASNFQTTNISVESNESITTSISSNVSSSTKILTPEEKNSTNPIDKALLSELTPPPTPDNMTSGKDTGVGNLTTGVLFDYTKIPNILTQKEPGSGISELGNRVDVFQTNIETDKNNESVLKRNLVIPCDEKINNSIEKSTEIRNVTAVHMAKKSVDGEVKSMEARKIKVDEIWKNGDVEVKKDFEEYKTGELKPHSITKPEKEDDMGNNKNLENEDIKQTDSNVLKHLMLTSTTSNKTDSEKLLEFESITKINNEIKEKISKQELMGSLRKSISLDKENDKTVKNVKPDMEIENENVPLKDIVKKRVQQFSADTLTKSLNQNASKISYEENVKVFERETEQDSLVKSRLQEFLKESQTDNHSVTNEESVLKKIISSSKTNRNLDETCALNQSEISSFSEINEGSIYEKNNKESISQIKESKLKENAEYLKFNRNIEPSIEYDKSATVKETYIPIRYENKKAQSAKEFTANPESIETLIPIEIKDTILGSGINTQITRNTEKITAKETIIPIILNSEDQNTRYPINYGPQENKRIHNEEKDLTRKEIIIPIQIENREEPKDIYSRKTQSMTNLYDNKFYNNRDNKEYTKNISDKTVKIIPIKKENKLCSDQNTQTENNLPKSESKEIVIPIKLKDQTHKHSSSYEQSKRTSARIKNVKEISKSLNCLASKDEYQPRDNFLKKTLEKNESIIPVNLEFSKEHQRNIKINLQQDCFSTSDKDSKEIDHNDVNSATLTKKTEQKELKNVEKEPITSKNISDISKSIEAISLKTSLTATGHKKTGLVEPTDEKIKPQIEHADYNIKDKVPKEPSRPLKTESNPPPVPERKYRKIGTKESKKEDKSSISETTDNCPVNTGIIYTNVLSPPRPSSTNSESSESGGSSISTAKFNPNSSVADVTALKEDEAIDGRKYYEPLSLRAIVLNLLMSLPFGEEMLKELADVSKTIENFTNKLPFRGLSNALVNMNNNDNNSVSVKKEEDMSRGWYTQKDVVKNQFEEDGRKILQLHQKCLVRRQHDEESQLNTKTKNDDSMFITDIENRETEITSPTRLLTIIKEEPSESDHSIDHIKQEPVETENKRNFFCFEDNSNERCKAKNLSEWLTLARNKSKSTSNLDSTNIPINNLRRTFYNTQQDQAQFSNTRRSSLPQEFYQQQLLNIMEKEREIQRELEKLEDEKRKLQAEIAPSKQKEFQVDDFYVSKKGDFAERKEDSDGKTRPTSMPVFPTEIFRQQMYDEYMDKFSEREERKQHKVIKISSSNDLNQEEPQTLKSKEIIHPIEIEKEFMDKVKQKQARTCTKEEERKNELEQGEISKTANDNNTSNEPPIIVLDGDRVKGVETLPKHLQEFVDDLASQQDKSIWSPGQQRRSPPRKTLQRTDSQNSQKDDPISPVWTPKSATSSPTVERKEFRSVSFQSPVLSRKNKSISETITTPDSTTSEPPWRFSEGSSDTALNLSSTVERRLPISLSTPGLGSLSSTSRLPRAQNPTITLLQKAREGQLPRGAHYIDQDRRPPNDRPPIRYPGEVLYQIKNEYTSESESEKPKKMADLAPRKFEGIGPTTKDGMPLILRSEVKEKDQSKWYKRMYDTIHKQKPHRDEFVTVRYKQKRAHYPYTSGYLSEPEPGAYDSDFTEYKYATLDRRRVPQTHEYYNNNMNYMSSLPRTVPDKPYSSTDYIRNDHEKYKNQPGRIENYVPGKSSISEKEAKQWWDEVMDIFDGHLEQQNRVPPQKPKSFMNQALKESGYESDSTLIFKRKEETANLMSPKEQKEAYKIIQKGGDVPFQGLRKPAPERPKESPRKYVENEVTIHYKTPVRQEIKDYVSEDELAHRQAEAMKKIYEEERRRKYLQELQDMKSRRHTDNFIPSQKSPIPLNRYDDFDNLTTPNKTRPRSPEPRLVAKALYNFVGQTSRELTFRKGDLIYVRRQVDKNWYEGELNAMVGLFPVNYVEIVPYDGVKTAITPRKAHEGQARAKYNFVAQTHLELSLAKGELVTITRKVDENWFEGKIGGRKGIFPVAYVEVLIDPSDPLPPSTKPVASPAAHSLLLNGSAQGKESMGTHLYTPNLPNPVTTRERDIKDNGYHHAKPVQLSGTGTYSTLPKQTSQSPIDQALHIETQSDPIPYRALYKYAPQNDDELELLEGDTVFVLEKCDDGWYVGSSERTGAFGTFPGNYVEKI